MSQRPVEMTIRLFVMKIMPVFKLRRSTDQSFVLDPSKHSSGMQFETPYEATTNFFAGILQLNLTEKATTDIFRLTERLLNKTYQFCSQSIESHERIPLEALDCSISLTINGLKRFESSYRRK